MYQLGSLVVINVPKCNMFSITGPEPGIPGNSPWYLQILSVNLKLYRYKILFKSMDHISS